MIKNQYVYYLLSVMETLVERKVPSIGLKTKIVGHAQHQLAFESGLVKLQN